MVKNAAKHRGQSGVRRRRHSNHQQPVNRTCSICCKTPAHQRRRSARAAAVGSPMDAVKRRQKAMPAPTLRIDDGDLQVKSRPRKLTMVFAHMIQNAQDATPSGWWICSSPARRVLLWCSLRIMARAWMKNLSKNRLFRPFDTTKTGKGMGIECIKRAIASPIWAGKSALRASPAKAPPSSFAFPGSRRRCSPT